MTLKSPDIKALIANQFGTIIQADGFRYKKTDNEFRHVTGDFSYIFNIDQVGWSNSTSLHIRLYISQKRVESIIENILGKRRHKITMGQGIERIYNSPDGRKVENGNLAIWLYQDEDLEAAAESLGWYYRDIAKPYFSRYTNLAAIDDIMNNPPFDHCPADVGGMFYERCIKGLIVARLVNNPEYEKLNSIYDEEIKATMNDEFIEEYYKVSEYLKYNRVA